MGRMVSMNPRRAYLGLTPVVKSGLQTSLTTAAELDTEPFSKAALSLAALFTKVFGFGYDPKKLNDTAVTEAIQIALHQIWFNLTGEDLGGVNPTCVPGKCGDQHIDIFHVQSQYPNVPGGAAGRQDASQVMQYARQLIAEGKQQLVRPESSYYYDMNTNYMLQLFQQVVDAQTVAAASPAGLISSITGGAGGILPWLLGGLAVYQFVL